MRVCPGLQVVAMELEREEEEEVCRLWSRAGETIRKVILATHQTHNQCTKSTLMETIPLTSLTLLKSQGGTRLRREGSSSRVAGEEDGEEEEEASGAGKRAAAAPPWAQTTERMMEEGDPLVTTPCTRRWKSSVPLICWQIPTTLHRGQKAPLCWQQRRDSRGRRRGI
jgi:hypothetical protein